MFKEHEFCYWLKGYFELSDSNTLSPQQVQTIKDHLNLVFTKVTPDRNITETYCSTVDEIHDLRVGYRMVIAEPVANTSKLKLC